MKQEIFPSFGALDSHFYVFATFIKLLAHCVAKAKVISVIPWIISHKLGHFFVSYHTHLAVEGKTNLNLKIKAIMMMSRVPSQCSLRNWGQIIIIEKNRKEVTQTLSTKWSVINLTQALPPFFSCFAADCLANIEDIDR